MGDELIVAQATSSNQPLKRCSKCGYEYPATSDYFHHATPTRLRPECKKCACEHVQRWRVTNADKVAETRSRYNTEHHDKVIDSKRRWREKHPSGHRGTRYTHSLTIEEKREIDRRRYYANKERSRAKKRNREALKRAAEGTHTDADVRAQYKRQHGKCYYCQTKVGNIYHVDHVIPLSRGGSNGPDNLVIACPKCNRSKHDKLPSEWTAGGRLL